MLPDDCQRPFDALTDEPVPRRRRRLAVLVALLALVIVLGLIVRRTAQQTQEAADYAEAVESIVNAGGAVRFDFALSRQNPQCPYVVVEIEAKTDNSLRGVEHLGQLRHVTLSTHAITDAALSYIERLPSLESLHLEDTAVTDRGIKRFRQAFPGCRVTRAAVK
jgi:hypothetical protein